MELRRATDADLEAIRSIYNLEVTESLVTFDLVPRTVAEQQVWMKDHEGAYPVIVAVEDNMIMGFASLSPYRPRPAYSTTVEDSIYVHRDARGKGVGKALLTEIVQLAKTYGFHSVIARIVGDHHASISLHQSVGFNHVGIEREVGRKFNQWLDVAEMQIILSNN